MLFELILYVCFVDLGQGSVSCLQANPYGTQVTSLAVCSQRLDEQTILLFQLPEWQNIQIVQYSITCRPANLAGLSESASGLGGGVPASP